jgi:hypothetical protein
MNTSCDNLDFLATESDFPGIEDVPILFHVGPHKTGSSWLQKRFFPALDNVVYSDDFKLTHGAFLIPRFGEFSVNATVEIFSELLDEARKSGRPLVLSDEALRFAPVFPTALTERLRLTQNVVQRLGAGQEVRPFTCYIDRPAARPSSQTIPQCASS